ncbi:hypothetical protein QZH41_002171 [Actinostola sp. cb2023]|nr:hypothetical protein QZH41_002171 [Actinostola sp. cb2023]
MTTNYTSNSTAYYCSIAPQFHNYNITSLPDSVVPTWIFLSAVNGIAAPLTVIINLLIIWTVLENENLRSVSYNLLLAALAVTDLLIGLVVQPLYVWRLGCLVLEYSVPCQLITSYVFLVLTCSCLTLCTLMMVSVERYLAIEHPHFYRTKVTAKKTMITMLIVWVTMPTVLVTGRSLVDADAIQIPALVIIASNVLIILFCTIKVQVTAYRQRRAIAQQVAPAVQQEEQEEQQNRLQEYKRIFTMSMLVLASVLFYSPVIITAIIKAIEGKNVPGDFKYISQPIYATFIYLQSLVNPLIMSLRLSYIRQGVKNKLFCLN